MKDLPVRTEARTRQVILQLSDDPRPHGSRKLKRGLGYRVRVGDYRIIYDIDDRERLVIVEGVLHRSEDYYK